MKCGSQSTRPPSRAQAPHAPSEPSSAVRSYPISTSANHSHYHPPRPTLTSYFCSNSFRCLSSVCTCRSSSSVFIPTSFIFFDFSSSCASCCSASWSLCWSDVISWSFPSASASSVLIRAVASSARVLAVSASRRSDATFYGRKAEG